MQAHLNLIEVDVDQFFTIRANFGDLTVKIDWISTAWATRNDNANDSCLMLHSGAFLFHIMITAKLG